tara:strand:- start:47 stop:1120 length:1074 start_codon:yes stop_codon:yes gene_type:complete
MTTQSTGQTFGGMLSGLGDWLGANASGLASVGSIYGALDNASDIRDLGYATQQHMENMGNSLNQNSQFQGYGVTSGLGNSTVGGDGSINLGVGPSSQLINAGMANQVGANNTLGQAAGMGHGQSAINYSPYANQAMQNSLADPSQRQGEIYNQMMAIQNPMLDAQQAQQQAREYAMGRGGVMGSAYGGTAEDAAMARARAQASNEAVMGAMKQADTERQMFGQMGAAYGGLGNQAIGAQSQYQGMLGNLGAQMGQLGLDQQKAGYLPMQMQMELLNSGVNTGGMSQKGQLTGQDYLAQLLLGGTNANINAQKVSSELQGNLYDSILDNLGGSSDDSGSASGLGGLLSDVGGFLGKIF